AGAVRGVTAMGSVALAMGDELLIGSEVATVWPSGRNLEGAKNEIEILLFARRETPLPTTVSTGVGGRLDGSK
ncbi:hypothetical protein GW17_00044565, partial [Ensete ventricosum]